MGINQDQLKHHFLNNEIIRKVNFMLAQIQTHSHRKFKDLLKIRQPRMLSVQVTTISQIHL